MNAATHNATCRPQQDRGRKNPDRGEGGEFASSLFILRIQAYRAFLDNFYLFPPTRLIFPVAWIGKSFLPLCYRLRLILGAHGCMLRRRHLAVWLLQRRDLGNLHRVNISIETHPDCYTVAVANNMKLFFTYTGSSLILPAFVYQHIPAPSRASHLIQKFSKR